MKNSFRHFRKLFVCIILLTGIQSVVSSQGNSEGKIKNNKGKMVISFNSEGQMKDLNDDLLFTINAANGNIKDANNEHIGKIVNNQIFDWENNVLYTLTSDNKILDMNSHQVGSIIQKTKEIKNLSGTTMGYFENTEPIFAIYYYFVSLL